jgi:predicted RNase H-like nuclease (RuvC/YqgF family)
MEIQKNSPKTLQECEEKLKQLEEENHHLREASRAFGQLAERLNNTLQEERRTAGSDRRQRPRPYGERRKSRDSTFTLAPHASNDED